MVCMTSWSRVSIIVLVDWSIIEVFNTINNYFDHICFHIKQQITKKLNRGIVCIFDIILRSLHTANKVLLQKLLLII